MNEKTTASQAGMKAGKFVPVLGLKIASTGNLPQGSQYNDLVQMAEVHEAAVQDEALIRHIPEVFGAAKCNC